MKEKNKIDSNSDSDSDSDDDDNSLDSKDKKNKKIKLINIIKPYKLDPKEKFKKNKSPFKSKKNFQQMLIIKLKSQSKN